MKLNNRGWGIREMLVLSGILVFFFGLALYFIYTLYSSLSLETKTNLDKNLYYELEDTIEQATIKYLKDNIVDDGAMIDLNLLIENDYIKEIVDPETRIACEGYSVIEDYNKKEVTAYISCDNYVTLNY